MNGYTRSWLDRWRTCTPFSCPPFPVPDELPTVRFALPPRPHPQRSSTAWAPSGPRHQRQVGRARGRSASAGGLCGQMYEIGTRSRNRNSFFFGPAPAFGHPPIVRAGRRRRPIFLAANQLGPDARLTSVGRGGRNTPLARGGTSLMAGRNPTQCPKRPTQSWTLCQSARNSWHIDHFERHFSTQCPFCRAISDAMPFYPRDSWHNVHGALLYLAPWQF